MTPRWLIYVCRRHQTTRRSMSVGSEAEARAVLKAVVLFGGTCWVYEPGQSHPRWYIEATRFALPPEEAS